MRQFETCKRVVVVEVLAEDYGCNREIVIYEAASHPDYRYRDEDQLNQLRLMISDIET
ncbi:MAG: hypothetical protein AAF902_09920 [Chloroflexota bacterium]